MRQEVMRTSAYLAVLLWFCAVPVIAVSAGPAELGRVYLRIDGSQVPNLGGDPVLESPELVRTHTHPAQVRLFNGAVLELEANTAVSFAQVEGDAVRATVLSGAIEIRGNGRIQRAATRSVFLVAPVESDAPISESQRARIEAELESEKNDDGVHQRLRERRKQ